MNEKTAKRVRKTLKNLGLGHAPLKMFFYVDGLGRFPTTLAYPKGSFQRVYRNIKNKKPEFHFPLIGKR